VSTIYGSIPLRDEGRRLEVDAFGVTHCVKLRVTGRDRRRHRIEVEYTIDGVENTQKLIELLELALEHLHNNED